MITEFGLTPALPKYKLPECKHPAQLRVIHSFDQLQQANTNKQQQTEGKQRPFLHSANFVVSISHLIYAF